MHRLVLIVHNVRSAHNVGSILRSADGFGVNHVYLSGYTPYPKIKDDMRLPHMAQRATKQISKTALGAEKSVNLSHEPDVLSLIDDLKKAKYLVLALEQTKHATAINEFRQDKDTALVVGSEIGGIPKDVLAATQGQLEISMSGKKESFNVAVAAAVALYHLRFMT